MGPAHYQLQPGTRRRLFQSTSSRLLMNVLRTRLTRAFRRHSRKEKLPCRRSVAAEHHYVEDMSSPSTMSSRYPKFIGKSSRGTIYEH